MIRRKRAYEPAEASDGVRLLIDRLWPRGISRDAAHLDAWRKDLAPSDELRRWYGHDPARYPMFRARYRAELRRRPSEIAALVALARRGTLTLVYAAKDAERSNAAVLAELVEESLS